MTLREIKEGFTETADDIQRNIEILNKELKIYAKLAKKIKFSGLSAELQDYMLTVLKEMYMKTDPRYKHLDRLKVMQQFMRQEKYGITEDDIARAKEVSIWSLHDFQKKRGQSAACPFHLDESPSFAVRRNKWICFGGCGKGDAIDFVMKYELLTFPKAVKYLLERA